MNPRVDCPTVPCNEADRGILSRQMDVDRQMLITAERDGYFGVRAKPALGIWWPNLRSSVAPRLRFANPQFTVGQSTNRPART